MSYVSLGGLGAIDVASMRAYSATLPTRHACREYWRPWALNPFIGETARRELAACLQRTGGLTHPIYQGTSGLGYHAGPLPTPPVAGFGYHAGPLPTPPVAGLGCPCAGDRSGMGQANGGAMQWVGPIGVLALAGAMFWIVSRIAPAPAMSANRRHYRSNAKWSYRYKSGLPDSAFLWVRDSERKFPVYDTSGRLDLPHLRNAIARIPVANIPASEKRPLQARARRMLAMATGRPYERLERRAAASRARRERRFRRAA